MKTQDKLKDLKAGKLPSPESTMPNKLEPKVEPSPKGGAPKSSAVCSICGKDLTQPASIAAGMGDICADKVGRLPAGTDLSGYRKSKTVDAIPEGFIKLSELIAKGEMQGLAPGRIVKAVGGDRLLGEVFSPAFEAVYVGRTRYVSKEAIKELPVLLASINSKFEEKLGKLVK